jgi:hypothetical protein
MRKIRLPLLIFFAIFQVLNAQENNTLIGSQNETSDSSVYFGLDISSRYIWRGQPSGGNHIVVQPTIEWYATDNLTFGASGLTNFQNKDYYSDGFTPKGYVELDLFVNYVLNDFLTIQLFDYYWPNLEKNEEIDNDFFNYSETGSKTLDLNLVFDFSEIWLPFNATVSTFLAGNDYRYDENDENPKQNFTTYVEFGYRIERVFKAFDLNPTIGAVLNNKAEYYCFADYDKVSFINLKIEVLKEIKITDNFSLPISIKYIHNAATKNTEITGKNFFTASFLLKL